jgi:predicted DNA-binding transcriptional regulator AlpA
MGRDQDDRVPAYCSRRTLAKELDCAESTVDELVKRGVLPKPVHITSSCVRWIWDDIKLAIASLKEQTTPAQSDPYLAKIRNMNK